jgi:hypothetical protein
MNPELSPEKLSQHDAAMQRAAAQALKSQPTRSQSQSDFSSETDSMVGNSIVSSRQPTPTSTPVNSDDEGMSHDQERLLAGAKKRAVRGVPRSGSAPDLKAPKKEAPAASRFEDNPATRSRAVAEPSSPATATEGTKAAAAHERLQERKDRRVPGQRSLPVPTR